MQQSLVSYEIIALKMLAATLNANQLAILADFVGDMTEINSESYIQIINDFKSKETSCQ